MREIIINTIFRLLVVLGRAARRLMGYKDMAFGTCEYAIRETRDGRYVLGVINKVPHNGTFKELVKLLEFKAAKQRKRLVFEAVMNDVIKHYLIKRGYVYDKKTGNAERQF
jgi:hypothetical protein